MDMMKSTSLDNAPTQSLLSVVNGILDESIERKNGEIPYRVTCLLRKAIQEIERRISTQADHIRSQNNLIKACEDKYQSRIKVLETLASGASDETQMKTEVKSWPYSFPRSKDYPTAEQRGSVTGRLFVSDRFINKKQIPAHSAYVGLALPGEPGSWQRESKGYQFWTKTSKSGYFTISNVRAGEYNFYAYVPGFIGDFKLNTTIQITAGSSIHLGDNIVYEPPRDGPTLWKIGIPDRTAAEFFVPDPNPFYVNNLYLHHPEKFRQYGLWERYVELYPHSDVVYTVGKSDYKKDWFFAHVTRI